MSHKVYPGFTWGQDVKILSDDCLLKLLCLNVNTWKWFGVAATSSRRRGNWLRIKRRILQKNRRRLMLHPSRSMVTGDVKVTTAWRTHWNRSCWWCALPMEVNVQAAQVVPEIFLQMEAGA